MGVPPLPDRARPRYHRGVPPRRAHDRALWLGTVNHYSASPCGSRAVSSAGERPPHTREVTGSIPVLPMAENPLAEPVPGDLGDARTLTTESSACRGRSLRCCARTGARTGATGGRVRRDRTGARSPGTEPAGRGSEGYGPAPPRPPGPPIAIFARRRSPVRFRYPPLTPRPHEITDGEPDLGRGSATRPTSSTPAVQQDPRFSTVDSTG